MTFPQIQKFSSTSFGIFFTIDRSQGDWIILKNPHGHELPWPKEKLPAHYQVGDQIELAIKTSNQSDGQYVAMRKLLEELIN